MLTLDEEEWISKNPNFSRNSEEDSCDRLGKLPTIKNISDITPSLFELHSVLCLCPTFDFSTLFLELFEEGMKLEAIGEWEWDWQVVVPWIALFVHQNIQEVRGRDIGDGGDGEVHVCFTSKIVSILNDEAQRAINDVDARALMSTYDYKTKKKRPRHQPPNCTCDRPSAVLTYDNLVSFFVEVILLVRALQFCAKSAGISAGYFPSYDSWFKVGSKS